MDLQVVLAVGVFILCFGLLTNNKINQVIVALAGGIFMLVFGIVDQNKAFSYYIDWNVIFLLIGMMFMVGIIKTTGLFQYIAIKTAKVSKGEPIRILVLLFVVTGVLSAFLDNVTTIMIITPISILIAIELGLSPLPFVITQAIASNIGGTATLIGDPPNLMIGSAANLTFIDFIKNLAPVICFEMIISVTIFWFFFRKKLQVNNERKARILEFEEKKQIKDVSLLIFSGIVMAVFITMLFLQDLLHLHAATIALFCAIILMIRNHKNLDLGEFFGKEVEWESIFFFIGLFILVGGLEEVGVIEKISHWILQSTKGDIKSTSIVIVWGFGIASAFVNNIPFVATMIPLITKMSTVLGKQAVLPLWWSLSLGACLGGNGTLIGASANVISAGIAKKSGYPISFWQFTKYGAIITIINLAISSIYIGAFFF